MGRGAARIWISGSARGAAVFALFTGMRAPYAAPRHAAGLPKEAAAGLCEAVVGVTSRVVETVHSVGGLKLVVERASGRRVETVLILHDHVSSGKQRCTV